MFRKVLDHFFNRQDQRRIDTEFYPDPVSSRNQDDFPARMRGMIFNDIEKCTGCGDCVDRCPTRCIQLEAVPIPNSKKNRVTVFDVDFSSCVFCGYCVEVCEPGSLIQTKKVQPAASKAEDLILGFGRGKLR